MGKLLRQLFVALGQAIWYRISGIFGRAPALRAGAPGPDAAPLRIDLGCGTQKKKGFLGCDQRAFPGVDVVMNLMTRWPWHDNTVDEAHMSHALEHFTGLQRVHIFNELYRVLKPGAFATIITPHWGSTRAYGDFTHAWPPVSEFLYSYLLKEWRAVNAPDTDIGWNPAGYNCDFEAEVRFTLHPQISVLDDNAKNHAITFFKEACQDMVVAIRTRK
jgi:Methyltransferase domain